MLRGLLSLEESESAKVIKELECEIVQLLEEGLEDKKLIEDLRRELSNGSQEIQYLQDQLNMRNVEANCVAEHVHSLELKLLEVQKLNDELNFLRDELNTSESERLFLTQMLDKRGIELQKYNTYLGKLEGALSSTALESLCEVEAVKLDLVALENRCFDAEEFGKEAIQEKARMESRIQELERRLEYSKERIIYLEEENKNFQEELEKFERSGKQIQDKIMKHIDGLMGKQAAVGSYSQGLDIFEHDVQSKPECAVPETVQPCTSEDVWGPILFKLAAVTASDGSLKEEMEKMSRQIAESELLINQLKEELKEEKLKAKEEGEDLTQEMAELRYQITDMLEHECKRRACIEQASMQRIKELEAQLRRERRGFSIVNGQLNKVRKLMESSPVQSLNIGKERLKVTEAYEKCKCKMCVIIRQTLDSLEEPVYKESYSGDCLNQATLGWHSD